MLWRVGTRRNALGHLLAVCELTGPSGDPPSWA